MSGLATDRPVQAHQPFLHDLAGVFRAPVQAWSQPSGEMTGLGAEGIFLGDTRAVSVLRCEPVGAELSPLGEQIRSADEVEFRDVVSLEDGVVDPIVTLHRTRTAGVDGVAEVLTLVSDDDRPRTLHLRMGLVTDAASMSAVKDPLLLAEAGDIRPRAVAEGSTARWALGTDGGEARLEIGEGASGLTADGALVTWQITLEVAPHSTARSSWRLALEDPAVPFAASGSAWTPSTVSPGTAARSADASSLGSSETVPSPEQRAAALLLERSVCDLGALRLRVPGEPAQEFFAAGAPWFFTLFGRDSLIAASLALPLDRGIATSTLRTLAARQGTRVDVRTAEQPGKILHEVRAAGMEMGETHLPPVYYGTIDATPLWIELLHETRAAGLPDADLAELRPFLEAAATWLLEHADADGDGLLEYIDESGQGLANQGWKDSGDSIRFADGSLASGTIALAEVQGYAYAAARHAADLFEETACASADLPSRLRAWAERLRKRFQATFWCEDELGPFVALALDGRKRPVDGVASNMGHLLGTGILDPDQERIVVDRLLHPSMFSGFGIRTLSTTNGGYGPLRYHGGSVWTHDTGVILRGMLRSGFVAEARVIARGLLRAADGFAQRLPELFSGAGTDEVRVPVPYPASCRPQAWAAATSVPVAQALGAL
ncbi:MAG TPA: amylo-alpha-1,6-glucosidase [Candidatus Brachybacterium intestinipullorum]|uniref:Amylo-alpha-1,6-glucosidase n=1 Tax=Candidatus Brachybacterium intestinipullorum TaxID=2838512 RepID=A0A9D2PZF7_9MICO|nr:amylo-alpha-1,6-glucosidase [Candidatus Brachybacterium intestinipullorum]